MSVVPTTDANKPMEFGETMPIGDLALADEAIDRKYYDDITDDERIQVGQSLVELLQKDESDKEEAAIWAKHFRERRKETSAELKKKTNFLRTGRIERTGTVFKYIEAAKGMVHFYDQNGKFLEKRRMNAEEAQLTIK